MFRVILLIAVLVMCLPAQAGVIIDTYTGGADATTSGWFYSAQTFRAPDPDSVLLSYRFTLADRQSPGSVLFSIYQWTGSSPDGPALFSRTIPWDAAGPVDVLGINLSLAAGGLYAGVIDLLGYESSSIAYTDNLYAGGHGFWSVSGASWESYPEFDHRFHAEFASTSVPEPAALLLVGCGLALLLIRRKLA